MANKEKTPKSEVGKLLHDQFKKLGLDQDALVKKAEGAVSKSELSHYQSGGRPVPFSKMALIARIYEVDPRELLLRDERLQAVLGGEDLKTLIEEVKLNKVNRNAAVNLNFPVSLKDLQYLIKVFELLQQPHLTMFQLFELLKLHQSKPATQ